MSVAATSRDNWVVGIRAHHGNPYDGHTLASVFTQRQRLKGSLVKVVYCNRDYSGHKYTEIHEDDQSPGH